MNLTELSAGVDRCFDDMRAILMELVTIPSVSAPGHPTGPVRRSAERIAELLTQEGATGVRLLELPGVHPSVYGELDGPEGAPTVLLYAHHDVQPSGPVEEWETAPFEPFERDGRVYGRGASDDISGVVMHLATLRVFDGAPPVSLKFLIEGEEEVGSANAGALMDTYADLLASDVIVIADAGVWRVGVPAMTTSLRGLVACHVEVRTGTHAVHSGQFGGVFPDAVTCLARLLATLHDDTGEVAVAGLDRHDGTAADLDEDDIRALMGAPPGLHPIGSGPVTSRLWTKPSISVLAIDAPPVAEAINQLVPVASAKVSMRIAPGQDETEAANALRTHLLGKAPWGADVSVTVVESGPPFQLPRSGPAADAWWEAMEEVWGTAAVEMGAGGSIPLVAHLSRHFPDAAILLTGAGDPTSSIHAPNESQDLGELRRSILAQVLALTKLG